MLKSTCKRAAKGKQKRGGAHKMHVIYVDDEQPNLDNFKLTVQDKPEVDSLHLFRTSREALRWTREHKVDVAFLDIEMPQKDGITLARELQNLDLDIRIIFVTAFKQYALDAFGVHALGYILKPYDYEEIKDALERAARMQPSTYHRVSIQTMPEFVLSIEGRVVNLGGAKTQELLALLVDRAEAGLNVGEAIACLWPERSNDERTQALYRTTFHNLMNILKEEGVGEIVRNEGRYKYINMNRVDCDLYHILAGEDEELEKYNGAYMSAYSWAEMRNAQLYERKEKYDAKKKLETVAKEL